MSRHNKYLLSLLTFIAKCANVSDADLDAAVESFGLQIVVHGQAETPLAQLRRTGSSASQQAGRGLTQRGNRTGFGSRGGQTGGLALGRRTSMSPGGPGAAGRAMTSGSGGGGGGGGKSLSRRVTEDPFASEALQSPSLMQGEKMKGSFRSGRSGDTELAATAVPVLISPVPAAHPHTTAHFQDVAEVEE